MVKNLFDDDYFLTKILPIALIVKISWITLLVIHFYTKNYYTEYDINHAIDIIQELIQVFYNIIMGLILTYIFKHNGKICISHNAKEYLFIFGVLMILGNFKKITHMYYFDETSNLWKYIHKQFAYGKLL